MSRTPEAYWLDRFDPCAIPDRPNIYDTNGVCPACGADLYGTLAGMAIINDKCPACSADCVAVLREQWATMGEGEV